MKQFDTNHTRYIKQRDLQSCSAVVLLNLHKWQGFKITEKQLPKYRKLLQTDPFLGTSRKRFRKIIGKRGRRLTYAQLKAHNGATILDTEWPEGGRHHYLVIGWGKHNTTYGWVAINYKLGVTYSLIPASTMKCLLKRSLTWTFKK